MFPRIAMFTALSTMIRAVGALEIILLANLTEFAFQFFLEREAPLRTAAGLPDAPGLNWVFTDISSRLLTYNPRRYGSKTG